MTRLALHFVPVGVLSMLAMVGACGDDGGEGASGPSSGPSGPVVVAAGTGSTGSGSNNGGDCSTNTECAPNGTCVELTPGGFRTCQTPPTPSTQCDIPSQGGGGGGTGGDGSGGGGPLDECCNNGVEELGCDGDDLCVRTPLVVQCGAPEEPPHNVCIEGDEGCNSNAECANQGAPGFCLPPGTFGNIARACVRLSCAVDSECTAQAGGRCVPVEEPCCGAIRGLFCTYEGSGCRSNADCPGGWCDVNGGVAACVSGSPPCQ
jgi:hypothetical protein